MGTLLQVLGAITMAVGLWMVWPPFGFVFAGLMIMAFGVVIARNNAG